MKSKPIRTTFVPLHVCEHMLRGGRLSALFHHYPDRADLSITDEYSTSGVARIYTKFGAFNPTNDDCFKEVTDYIERHYISLLPALPLIIKEPWLDKFVLETYDEITECYQEVRDHLAHNFTSIKIAGAK